jgi:hypothetical protein
LTSSEVLSGQWLLYAKLWSCLSSWIQELRFQNS